VAGRSADSERIGFKLLIALVPAQGFEPRSSNIGLSLVDPPRQASPSSNGRASSLALQPQLGGRFFVTEGIVSGWPSARCDPWRVLRA
jgi:hypothetical protein